MTFFQYPKRLSSRRSRLDTWILALALLWLVVGITLLWETHPRRHDHAGQEVNFVRQAYFGGTAYSV